MNYFELFSLPVSFDIPEKELTRSYLNLQRQFHPDRFVNAPENEKLKAAQKSADINEGYKILKDDLLRAQCLLALKGVIVGREKADNIKPSQALLAEMMELGEQFMECGTQGSVECVQRIYQQEMKRSITEMSAQFAKGDYPAAADLYFRAKFVWRLIDNAKLKLKGISSHAA